MACLEAGRERSQHVAPVRAQQQGALGVAVGITQLDAHEKAVQLRFGQREGADLRGGVLRGDDEEGLGQTPRLAFGRDLMLFHGLQQRRLCLGRAAVHLVGQYHLEENGARVEFEARRFAVIHGHTYDVGGQHVAGELDAVEIQPQQARQHLGQRGLAHAGQIFDEQVAARQQAGEGEADLVLFAENDFGGLVDDVLYGG